MKKSIKICFLVIFTLVFCSCSLRVQESYFIEKIEAVDNLIDHGLYSDAVKTLSKLEKKAYSPIHSISVAKRYVYLNEFAKAEKFLSKSVKINSDSDELKALYVWVLLKENKIQQAYSHSVSLQNSDFSGLYAEAFFKKLNQDLAEKNEEITYEMYLDQNMQKEYLAAFRVSNNIGFLQNAAVYECFHGNFDKAYSYHPIKIPNNESAEFWTLVCYDSKNYVQAIKDAEQVLESDVKRKARVSVISADAYLRMNELANAQAMWEQAFRLDSEIDPNLLMNYAYSYLEQGDTQQSFVAVKKAVQAYSDYLPALSLYCKFAINDSVPESESSLSRELRKLGLKSKDMIARDSRERILISDAAYKLNQSYERTGNPMLQVELLKLKWVQDKKITKEEMAIDVWNLLEHHYTNEENPDNQVLDYAIEFFIQHGDMNSASELMNTRFAKEFGAEDYMLHLDQLSYAECRLAAAVKFYQKNYDDCQKLLNQCAKSANIVNDDVYINLANFAETDEDYKLATKYYSQVITSTMNVLTRAEMCYRLANMSMNRGDMKNAQSYLDYCLRLNPVHSEARIMQKKIRP